MSGLLLDTCAMLWIANDEPISEQATMEVRDASSNGIVFVSPMSAWEVAMLVSKNRVALSLTPEAWFQAFLELEGVNLAPLTPAILMASAFLPGRTSTDPADRIIASTARAERLTLVTRDAKLLDYAEQGHIRALGC